MTARIERFFQLVAYEPLLVTGQILPLCIALSVFPPLNSIQENCPKFTNVMQMKRTAFAPIALVSVAFSWGAAFVLMKDAIAQQPFFDFLAIRFTIATAIMVIAKPRVLTAFNALTLKHGAILGLLLAFGYVTQTIGLDKTTAAITGFITGLYVVLTPIIGWLLLGRSISRQVFLSLIMAVGGLALISLRGLTIDAGQLWVVLCAILLALHIVGLSVWSPGKDVYALTVVQLFMLALVSWVGALSDGSYQPPPNSSVWFAVLFTALIATAVAFFVQTWAQSIMDASRVAILLTSEVVWAAIVAVAAGQETLEMRTVLGGFFMVGAMLLAEWPTASSRELAVTPQLRD